MHLFMSKFNKILYQNRKITKNSHHMTVPRYEHLAQWKNFRCPRANDDGGSIFQAIQTAWIETVARGPRRMVEMVFVKISRCEFKIQKISWILFERLCRLYEQTKICSRCQKWIKMTFSDIRLCLRVFQEPQISSIYISNIQNLWNSYIWNVHKRVNWYWHLFK